MKQHGPAPDFAKVTGHVVQSTIEEPMFSSLDGLTVEKVFTSGNKNDTSGPKFRGLLHMLIYGFFLRKRVANPVVDNIVKTTWSKYGLVRSMFRSTNELFFSSKDGIDAMLETGPWFIWNNSFILKRWDSDVNLIKKNVGNVPVWVKLHGVPMIAFIEDGLSAIATKLGTPLMLDSYISDMCMHSWDMSSYARAMIELRAYVKLRDTILVAMYKLVFGHVLDECPKKIILDEVKNLKNPRQGIRGVHVGPNVGFKPVKQVYKPVSNKNGANTSGKKMQAEVPRKELSNSNPFDAFNFAKNNDDLGTNGGNSKSARKESLNVAHEQQLSGYHTDLFKSLVAGKSSLVTVKGFMGYTTADVTSRVIFTLTRMMIIKPTILARNLFKVFFGQVVSGLAYETLRNCRGLSQVSDRVPKAHSGKFSMGESSAFMNTKSFEEVVYFHLPLPPRA
nr:hypothetical protein [Tanacetum cinerariifolium]